MVEGKKEKNTETKKDELKQYMNERWANADEGRM